MNKKKQNPDMLAAAATILAITRREAMIKKITQASQACSADTTKKADTPPACKGDSVST